MAHLTPWKVLAAAAFSAAASDGATTFTPGNVFSAGETATLDLGASHDAWCVLDAATYPQSEDVLATGTSSGTTLLLPHGTLGGKLGGFVLRSWQTGGSATNETRFAFIPPGYVKPCPWVGTNFHHKYGDWGGGDMAVLNPLLDVAAKAGIGIVRDRAGWGSSEAEPGVYAIPPLFESFVDALVSRGMSLCHLLAYDNSVAYPNDPINPTAFANWAGWVADHFAGRVDTYEIWNEPHNFYFYANYTNTVEVVGKTNARWIQAFTDFTRTADNALAGRGLRVCVASEDWTEILHTMIAQGIARPRNFLAIHPYAEGVRPEKGKWLRDGFADLRSHMATNGALGAGIAITEHGWSTYVDETGTADFRPATFAEQARYLVRMYLVAHEGGAAFTCQYDFKDDGKKKSDREDNWGMLDRHCHPKPSYAAVAAMTRFVGDATLVGEVGGSPENFRIQHFQRDGSTDIYIAWSVEGNRTATISGNLRSDLSQATAYDLYGNKIASPVNGANLSLTEDPVYFVTGAAATAGGDTEWGPPWLLSATSEPMMVFGNGRESLLWHTSSFGGTTLHWDKPKGATSATLTIEGNNYRRTWTGLTGESIDVSLPPASGVNENVYTLTLAFDIGIVRTAYLGAVTGLGSSGTATVPCVKKSSSPDWPKFQTTAAMTIPFGARALTVNGEPVQDLDGSAGWRLLKSSRGITEYELSLGMDGVAEPLNVSLLDTGGPTLIIVR